jgi:hypothetical protein
MGDRGSDMYFDFMVNFLKHLLVLSFILLLKNKNLISHCDILIVMKKAGLFVVFIGIGILFGVFSVRSIYAQGINPADNIFFEVTPEYPKPNELVSLGVKSYVYDLNIYAISWYVNGELVQQEVGGWQFEVNSGDIGERTVIKVVVHLSGLTSITKARTLHPLITDVLWEAHEGYVPPFYKGRTLPVRESKVKVVGIPDPSAQNKAVFRWYQGFTYDEASSGFEKDYYIIEKTLLDDGKDIRLITQNRDTGSMGQDIIEVPMSEPKVVIYPDLGGDVILRNSKPASFLYVPPPGDFAMQVIPFYFPVKDPDTLKYKWWINDNRVDENERVIPLERGRSGGTARLEVEVSTPGKILQYHDASISISL